MKIYKSRRDALTMIIFIIGILLSLIVIAIGMFVAMFVEDAVSRILGVMFIGIGGAALASLSCNVARTDYTFYEDIFQVRGGFSKKQLTYKQIYALERTEKIFCLNALARKKFQLLYRGDGPKIYISPEHEAEFIKEMKLHCKNLQIKE